MVYLSWLYAPSFLACGQLRWALLSRTWTIIQLTSSINIWCQILRFMVLDCSRIALAFGWWTSWRNLNSWANMTIVTWFSWWKPWGRCYWLNLGRHTLLVISNFSNSLLFFNQSTIMTIIIVVASTVRYYTLLNTSWLFKFTWRYSRRWLLILTQYWCWILFC